MSRKAWLPLSLVIVLVAYVAACVHVLLSLDAKFLIQMRVLEYDASAEPVIVPMPDLFKDVFWDVVGEKRVLDESRIDPSVRVFAEECFRRAVEMGEPFNQPRTDALFGSIGLSSHRGAGTLSGQDDSDGKGSK